MIKFIKKYGGAVLIVAIFAALVIISLSGGRAEDTWHAVSSMQPAWALAALSCWALFVVFRALAMYYTLRREKLDTSFLTVLRSSLIGLFYSGITPAATGGQPMQMYFLHKEGVPISTSATIVIMKFVGFQAMLLLLSFVFNGIYSPFVHKAVGSSYVLILIGFVCNAIVVVAVLSLAVWRKGIIKIADLLLTLGEKLRIVRSKAKSRKKVNSMIDRYITVLRNFAKSPLDLLCMFLLCGMQVFFYCSILYCLYRAFGFAGADFGQLLTIQLLLYQTASYVPLPGASGAQEGLFALFLANIVPRSSQMGMLLCWRFFTFYLTLIVGGIIAMTAGVHRKSTTEQQEE